MAKKPIPKKTTKQKAPTAEQRALMDLASRLLRLEDHMAYGCSCGSAARDPFHPGRVVYHRYTGGCGTVTDPRRGESTWSLSGGRLIWVRWNDGVRRASYAYSLSVQ